MNDNKPLGIKIIAGLDGACGIIIPGWFIKTMGHFSGLLYALSSTCPCTILTKIAVLVIVLLTILLIKSGVQILQLKSKGREDHINFSSIVILILLFVIFFNRSMTAIICGLLIMYLLWTILYLNNSRIKVLFNIWPINP